MKLQLDPALFEMFELFRNRITGTLKELFENKHLYQNITLEYTDILTSYLKLNKNKPLPAKAVEDSFTNRINGNWFPNNSKLTIGEIIKQMIESKTILFLTPDVKLYCKICHRIEAFNLHNSEDFLNPSQNAEPIYKLGVRTIQNFIFSYTCQSCKSVPEVFIVRRESFKLSLCGRTPIEYIDVPKAIPKEIKDYFSGAILAYQSGQTLAGLFYLRTLIEQWAYSSIEDHKNIRADQAIEKYMQQLPDDFKERFPSVSELYSDLSADIHRATGSIELFDKAKEQIIEHFKARELFKL